MNGYENIVGIDPGITGAIALVTGTRPQVLDMPVVKVNKKKMVSAPLVREALTSLSLTGSTLITIENVHAMPGQGVSSMFSLGRSAGIVEGVAAGMGYTTLIVTPQSWKKHFNLIGKDKDAARAMVACNPMWASVVTRKKDVGRADAILIGLFGATVSTVTPPPVG